MSKKNTFLPRSKLTELNIKADDEIDYGVDDIDGGNDYEEIEELYGDEELDRDALEELNEDILNEAELEILNEAENEDIINETETNNINYKIDNYLDKDVDNKKKTTAKKKTNAKKKINAKNNINNIEKNNRTIRNKSKKSIIDENKSDKTDKSNKTNKIIKINNSKINDKINNSKINDKINNSKINDKTNNNKINDKTNNSKINGKIKFIENVDNDLLESEVEDAIGSEVEDAIGSEVEDVENVIKSKIDNSNNKSGGKQKVNNTKVIKNTKSINEIPKLGPMQQINKERYEYRPEITKTKIIMDPTNRITKEYMSKFEYAEVLSIRSKQIENGGDAFTDVSNLSDPIEIAKKEILDKKCPISILRHLTDDIVEKWDVNELSIPDL